MTRQEQALIDLSRDVAQMLRGFNLVQLPPTPTRRDSANLTTQPKTMTTTKPQTPVRMKCQPYIDEYRANHQSLRRSGVSLADYCQTGLRDDGDDNYQMPSDLREILNEVQLKAFGSVADPMRPLNAV
jgi:hypothetical protein